MKRVLLLAVLCIGRCHGQNIKGTWLNGTGPGCIQEENSVRVYCLVLQPVSEADKIKQKGLDIKARDKRNEQAFKSLATSGGGGCGWDTRMEKARVICLGTTAWNLDTGYPWKPK